MLRNVLLVAIFLLAVAAYGSPLDSIGIKQKSGKSYIIHKVEPKETLYSLSRKYGVSVDEIKAANDNSTDLKTGETVLIPYKKSLPVEKNTSTNSGKKTIHKVQAKETLYSISKKYGVSIDDIKKANPGINVSDLKAGQDVVIPGAVKTASDTKQTDSKKKELPDTHKVEPKETYYSIAKKYDISIEELKKLNPGITELKAGQVIKLTAKAVETNTDATNLEGTDNIGDNDVTYNKPTGKTTDTKKRDYVEVKDPKIITGPENNVPTFSSIKKDGYTKVSESGVAEVYNDNSGFHYALHKTAPVGTIIYLVNETNGQKVYVRVMGKLTDATPGVILKISPKALEKLSKGESKVKVSATYIP